MKKEKKKTCLESVHVQSVLQTNLNFKGAGKKKKRKHSLSPDMVAMAVAEVPGGLPATTSRMNY
jgi:hypothetical protein